MNKIELKGIPTFRILDYEIAVSFYIDKLGFDIDWEHRFGKDEPVYMQISKHGLILHLTENQRFQIGIIIFVECKALNEFYSELMNRTVEIEIAKPQKTKWQTIEMEIEDPYGNLLRFNENILD